MPNHPKKLSPELSAWLDKESSDKPRTVIIRMAHSQDVDTAVALLEDVGITIQSSGHGTLVGIADARGLSEVVKFPWVIAVSTPQRLDTKL